ncbi:MAG: hypothetical protein GKR93_16590 [Gammaproteobacteria bacterium]|nr:hypothetical protein [Gammaproteobacteria bacterium]
MTVKLYGFGTPNMTKVLLTASQAGITYEYIHLNPAAGEIKTPEHLACHPLGKIPTLEEDDFNLYESTAICRYLANVSDTDLYGGDLRRMALIDQWTDFMTHHVGKWIGVYFFQEVVQKRFFEKDIDLAAMEEAIGFLKEQLPVIEKQLAENQYLCGDGITIADTIAFCFFNIHEVTEFEFNNYPNITRWYDLIKSSPAYEQAFSHLDGGMIIH